MDLDWLYRSERDAVALSAPSVVDADAVAAYARDGFLAVENVLSPEEIAAAKAALTDCITGKVTGAELILQPEPSERDEWARRSPDNRTDLVRKVWHYVGYAPRLKALACGHPVIERVLERLLGEPVRLIQDMALLKPPRIGTEKPWHQDMAYFGWGPPEKVIGVWLALDAATVDNGCMFVLPGTHLEGGKPHLHRRDCQLADELVAVERAVRVPLAPGGALFFSSLLHHGTPPNHSPHRRWALQFHYTGVSATPMDRREHAALFFDGDLYAGCRGQTGVPIPQLEP